MAAVVVGSYVSSLTLGLRNTECMQEKTLEATYRGWSCLGQAIVPALLCIYKNESHKQFLQSQSTHC